MTTLTKEETEQKRLLISSINRMNYLREQIEDNKPDLGLSRSRTQLSEEIHSIMKSINAISWYFH